MAEAEPAIFQSFVDDGPYLQAAILCDRVLEERDGVLSAIRIVELFGFAGSATVDSSSETERPPVGVPIALLLLVMLRALPSRGATLGLQLVNPSGRRGKPTEPVHLEPAGSYRGVNARFEITFIATETGTHWLEVLLDEALLTRVPFDVEINVAFETRTTAGSAESTERPELASNSES